MTASASERDLLEVARAAVSSRRESRRRARERALQGRAERARAAHEERSRVRHRLLSAAGLREPDIDALRRRGDEAVRASREEARRTASTAAGATPPVRTRRAAPFPPAPQLYQLVTLDTATFVGPRVDETGANFRALVTPDAPSPGHNFARAFLEVDSQHQSGFDPGHLHTVFAEAFFMFTAERAMRLNAGGFADWTGRDALLASWYPFDDCRGEASFTVGMDAAVVSPQGALTGMSSAAPDEGFDDQVDVGMWDFGGADLEQEHSSNSALFLWGLTASPADRVFLAVYAELSAYSKSVASTVLDFSRGGERGIDFPMVWAATFSP